MRDVTSDMRVADFRRALRQYGELMKKQSDTYAERSLHAIDVPQRDKLEGVSEGLLIAGEALIDASIWDTPDRPRATNEDKRDYGPPLALHESDLLTDPSLEDVWHTHKR